MSMHSFFMLSLSLSPSFCLSQKAKFRQQLQAPGSVISVLVLYVPCSSIESILSSRSQVGTVVQCRMGEQDHLCRTS